MRKATIGFAAVVVMATGALVSMGAGTSGTPKEGWQRTNTGEMARVDFKGHVLSETRGTGAVLYCPSQPDFPAFRAALSAALGGVVVDYFDPRAETPTLALLQNYDCVMTWVNFGYLDRDAMGNVLADYVDAGGRVILGQWCLPTAGNFLGGRIMTAGYVPVSGASYAFGATYLGDGTECATEGVAGGMVAQYCDAATLIGGNFADGSYDIGTLFTAWRPDQRVWYAPGNTGSEFTSPEADVVRWTANMCVCGAGESCPEDIDGDGFVGVGDLLAVLAAWGPCEATGACDSPYTCGGTLELCDPAIPDCYCWLAPDGSGVCGQDAGCADLTRCFGGQAACPADTVCAVETCCIDPVCLPACGVALDVPAPKPGDLMASGVYDPAD